MSPTTEVEETAEDIQTFVSGGKTLNESCNRLAKLGVNEQVLVEARLLYEQRLGIISNAKEPVAVVKDRERKWYGGPSASAIYWGEFVKRVHASLPTDVAEQAVTDIDLATSRVLDLAGAPGWPKIRTKGLVLGYVQSGKTTNFMGVMAKAADVGYRLFIVLSGITDNLRSQTQERIQEMLVGDHPERWYLLTDLDRDFAMSGNAANLLNDPNQRLIAVVKKNAFRLRRLKEWIETAGTEVHKGLPLMIIDDESDQASLDVGKTGRVSRINGLIGQLIKAPRSAYIAYTATPFANLLTEVTRYENLYPDDYIVEMKQPEGYFGPEQIFGRDPLSQEDPDDVATGLDVINIIPDSEADLVKPPNGKGAVYDWEPSVTPALAESVAWFLLATAARRARWSTVTHSTMLIHTSMLAEAHNRLKTPIQAHIRAMADKFESDQSLRQKLKSLWDEESAAVPAASMGLPEVSWSQIESMLPSVLSDTRLIVDNYMSQDRLYYRDGEPATVIVIGGNTLSRGLTLEGLVSSYFVRAASAYDTLLQMGRWFGYRRGYEDLPRIWMPEELAGWFQDLATVEEEIRRDIRSFGPDETPRDVGVRIRVHPSMAITSAAKMRGAVDASIDFGLKREQTITFEHQDEGWLNNNIAAARGLFADTINSGYETVQPGRTVIREIPSERILEFFGEYRMHPNALRLRTDLISGYIKEQMKLGALLSWNVVLIENPRRPEVDDLDLGFGRGTRTVERNRLKRYSAYANIKSLVSTIDRIADTGLPRGELPKNVDPDDDKSLAQFRQDVVGSVGLLTIYPIDKNSKMRAVKPVPGKKSPRDPRADLGAVDHVIGLGIYFPASVGDPIRYKSANIRAQVEDDSEELDAIELADEQLAADQEALSP